jgi:hypothetical protein
MRSSPCRTVLRRLVVASTLLIAAEALASVVYMNSFWPSAIGVPRNVHPLVFTASSERPTRFQLYDVGPAERETQRVRFVNWFPENNQRDHWTEKRDYRLPPGAALVATDARVLWRGERLVVELVPWAGRSLAARRHFVVVDGSVVAWQFVGAFETGDAFEETAPVLTGLEVREIFPAGGPRCAECSDSGNVLLAEIPQREYARLMAIWPEARPDGAPEAFFDSPRYGIGQFIVAGPFGLYLQGGEHRLVVRERRMNGAFGPPVHLQFTIPESPSTK